MEWNRSRPRVLRRAATSLDRTPLQNHSGSKRGGRFATALSRCDTRIPGDERLESGCEDASRVCEELERPSQFEKGENPKAALNKELKWFLVPSDRRTGFILHVAAANSRVVSVCESLSFDPTGSIVSEAGFGSFERQETLRVQEPKAKLHGI